MQIQPFYLLSPLSHSPLSPMRHFRVVETCSHCEREGLRDHAKERCRDRYKKMTAPLKRESPAVIFTGVLRNNRETAKFSKFDLSPIISHPSSRYDASRVFPKGKRSRGTERPSRSFSVNFLWLMKEHTRPTPKHTQWPILAYSVVEQPSD